VPPHALREDVDLRVEPLVLRAERLDLGQGELREVVLLEGDQDRGAASFSWRRSTG